MAEINFIMLGIIILFFILLAIKSIIGKNKIKKFPKSSLSPQQADGGSRRKFLIAKSDDAAELQSIKPNLAIKENLCVICASISLTWIVLLFLYFFDLFDNILIISLLMGMSVTGIYHFAESKIGKANKLKIFRLPFIITLIVIAYYILTFENIVNSILIVMALWLLFVSVYFYNNTKFIKKLLECCKE